jgi:hypothetical protein
MAEETIRSACECLVKYRSCQWSGSDASVPSVIVELALSLHNLFDCREIFDADEEQLILRQIMDQTKTSY